MKPKFVREAVVETIEADGQQLVVVPRDAVCDVCDSYGRAKCDLHQRPPTSDSRGLVQTIPSSWKDSAQS